MKNQIAFDQKKVVEPGNSLVFLTCALRASGERVSKLRYSAPWLPRLSKAPPTAALVTARCCGTGRPEHHRSSRREVRDPRKWWEGRVAKGLGDVSGSNGPVGAFAKSIST